MFIEKKDDFGLFSLKKCNFFASLLLILIVRNTAPERNDVKELCKKKKRKKRRMNERVNCIAMDGWRLLNENATTMCLAKTKQSKQNQNFT